MKKKLFLGIVVSALFVYLSLKDIDVGGVVAGFRSADCVWFAPVLFMLFIIQVLRSYRWGLLLNPFERIRPFDLFAVTSVGFLAVIAIPARIGELARPYLIAGKSSIPMAAALGTVFVERIFDILAVLTISLGILFLTTLPPWLTQASLLFLSVTLAVILFFFFIILKREKALAVLMPILQWLPSRFHHRLEDILHHFIDGLTTLSDVRLILKVFLLSLLVWIMDTVAIYLLFFSFSFSLPFTAAMVLMVILIIGIAIPTAPGFIGNFHFFCILGLSLFGISKADALSYAIILHVLSIGLIVILGLAFLPFTRFSFADLKAKFNSKS